jgi:hypothetical protein
MAAQTRIQFARINRRNPEQQPLDPRSFREDMEILGQRGSLRSQRGSRIYIAGDLEFVEEDFMIGVLGYAVEEDIRSFAEDGQSWIKGETLHAEGATRETVAPFAVDLRSQRRWVAFAPSGRIQAASFSLSFAEVLNVAVRELDLWPTDWEVDLVTSVSAIRAWIDHHPRVFKLRRKVKMTNPGLSLDEERARMRQLGAFSKVETISAGRNKTLNVTDNETFDEAIEGVERGDVEIQLRARGGSPDTEDRFSSTENPDETLVDAFGSDLVRGRELALTALKTYSDMRASEGIG